MSVDAGGLIYVSSGSGLASSQDAGATFTSLTSLATPIVINELRDDAHGGLLASTDHGVWRIGADERWAPIDRDLFPLPAMNATPVGRTGDVLVLRPAVDPSAGTLGRSGPESRGALRAREGASARTPSARPGLVGRAVSAFASDATAQRVVLDVDWTVTGGRKWHIGPGPGLYPHGLGGLVQRAQLPATARAWLWSRSGARPWKRGVRLAGKHCGQIAGEPPHLFVACADRLLRSDDAGRTFHRVAVPDALTDVRSMVTQPRRPDHIALLLLSSSGCTQQVRMVTLTSTDAGATWLAYGRRLRRTTFEKLAIAPNGDLLRWSASYPATHLQVLDGWRCSGSSADRGGACGCSRSRPPPARPCGATCPCHGRRTSARSLLEHGPRHRLGARGRSSGGHLRRRDIVGAVPSRDGRRGRGCPAHALVARGGRGRPAAFGRRRRVMAVRARARGRQDRAPIQSGRHDQAPAGRSGPLGCALRHRLRWERP